MSPYRNDERDYDGGSGRMIVGGGTSEEKYHSRFGEMQPIEWKYA